MCQYKIVWLCPSCGKYHRTTVEASNVLDATNKFEAYWREVNAILDEEMQLPLMAIKEVCDE